MRRYYATLVRGRADDMAEEVRTNLFRLFGPIMALVVTVKVIEEDEWGFILRVVSRDGDVMDKLVTALSFTRAGNGWMQPFLCSGTLKALRRKLKDVGLTTAKSG